MPVCGAWMNRPPPSHRPTWPVPKKTMSPGRRSPRAHVPAQVPVGVGRVRQPDAEVGVDVADEPRAVEAGGRAPTPHVGRAAEPQRVARRQAPRRHVGGREGPIGAPGIGGRAKCRGHEQRKDRDSDHEEPLHDRAPYRSPEQKSPDATEYLQLEHVSLRDRAPCRAAQRPRRTRAPAGSRSRPPARRPVAAGEGEAVQPVQGQPAPGAVGDRLLLPEPGRQLDQGVQAGRVPGHPGQGRLRDRRRAERAAAPVGEARAADMAVVGTRGDQLGQRELLERRRCRVGRALASTTSLDQPRRQHQPAQPQRRARGSCWRCRRRRRGRGPAPAARRPAAGRSGTRRRSRPRRPARRSRAPSSTTAAPPVRGQRHARAGTGAPGSAAPPAGAGQLAGAGAALVDRQRADPPARARATIARCSSRPYASTASARRTARGAAPPQSRAEPLREPRADHDPLGVGAHAAGAGRGSRPAPRAARGGPRGSPYPSASSGAAASARAGGGQPRGARERRQVGRCRAAGRSGRPRRRRRLRRRRRAGGAAAVGDPGARALAGGQPALGDQLAVGARRPCCGPGRGRRRARGRTAAGCPARSRPAADRLAQRALEAAAAPPAGAARGAGRRRKWPTFPASNWTILVGHRLARLKP